MNGLVHSAVATLMIVCTFCYGESCSLACMYILCMLQIIMYVYAFAVLLQYNSITVHVLHVRISHLCIVGIQPIMHVVLMEKV